jgi:hypothetical protein
VAAEKGAKEIALTFEEAIEQLKLANRILNRRKRTARYDRIFRRKQAARYPGSSSSEPGIFLLIEDAHLVFNHSTEAAFLAERLATIGNYLGIGLVVTLPDFNIARFGDRPALRQALLKNASAGGDRYAFEMFDEGER